MYDDQYSVVREREYKIEEKELNISSSSRIALQLGMTEQYYLKIRKWLY